MNLPSIKMCKFCEGLVFWDQYYEESVTQFCEGDCDGDCDCGCKDQDRILSIEELERKATKD